MYEEQLPRVIKFNSKEASVSFYCSHPRGEVSVTRRTITPHYFLFRITENCIKLKKTRFPIKQKKYEKCTFCKLLNFFFISGVGIIDTEKYTRVNMTRCVREGLYKHKTAFTQMSVSSQHRPKVLAHRSISVRICFFIVGSMLEKHYADTW